jgi:glycosyltransferase involved in cell wall biosynthesis
MRKPDIIMKLRFSSYWNNVWVEYLTKYFTSKGYDMKFNIASHLNLGFISDADVAVMCWADQPTIELSKLPLKYCKKYVVFVRSYEIFFGHIKNIRWSYIDDVIFVNQGFCNEFKKNDLPKTLKVHYLPNAIDLDKWQLQEHQKSFNVAMVCGLSHKKGLDLIPQFLYKLVKKDKRYILHIAGGHQEERHIVYMMNLIYRMGLLDHIRLYGHVDDVKEWLKDKDYLFTCSVTEGHPNNVIEAMSLGIKPIVHNWIGAEFQHPPELIWKDIDRAVELVTEDNYNSMSYRNFIKDNYDMWKVYSQLEDILLEKGG